MLTVAYNKLNTIMQFKANFIISSIFVSIICRVYWFNVIADEI